MRAPRSHPPVHGGRTLLLLLALLAPRAALAQSPRALLREGAALRRERRAAEALDRFRRAWELTRSPEALAEIGLTEHDLARWSDAAEHLAAALATSGNPWIDAVRPQLQRVLDDARRHLPPTSPPAPEPLPPTAPELPSLPPPAPVLAPPPPPPAPLARTLRWWSLGGSALFLGGGLSAHLIEQSLTSQWNDPARCQIDGRTRAANCASLATDADTAHALAIAGYATGAALAALTVALFAVSARHPTPRRALLCLPSLDNPGLTCGASL